MAKLAFIHTSHALIPVFSKLSREILPEVQVFHLTDESLIQNTIAAQALTKSTIRRLVSTIESAHEAGGDAVMVTCSSIGAGVKVARELFDFPILRVDEPMAEAAVAIGGRVGVAATLRTTLEPTIALLEETASQAGVGIQVVDALCEEAFQAFLAGNTERHDTLLLESLRTLARKVDVVVLAQASMARVAHRLHLNGGPPVLSSPELAVRRARGVLALEPAGAAR